ncbi:MAG TPA: heme-binding protein [Pyrinomonadaceae bacterium]|nr:heme-binding protein [Pyrinomonadaceae bacterium]
MIKNHSSNARRLLLLAALGLFSVALLWSGRVSQAQATRPVLISEANSTRAVALESVTRLHEPFKLDAPHSFSADRRTRVQLFVLNLERGATVSDLTVDAEDGAHRIYPLTLENIALVPNQEWMHSLTVRLSDEMNDVGDVLVRVRYKNIASNRVRLGIGHVGGGLADDPGAVPTAAPPATAPTPNTNPITAGNLTTSDVQTVIAQAVSAAVALQRPVTVAVTDKEGNVLGVFTMTGAPPTTQFRGNSGFNQQPNPITGLVQFGLEGANLPPLLMPVRRAAITKAGTAAFFSTQGNAFTPRTAGFIIQEHIPPGVDFRPGGPLYGVQFSQLECSDIKKPGLPFGLSADPGAVPLYKNGVHVGAVGIEGDGVYTVDRIPADFDKPFEEIIAVAAGRGYEPPPLIRGDNIIVDGVRLPYVNVTDEDAPRPATIPFANLPGSVDTDFPIRPAQPSAFVPFKLGPVNGAVDLRFFPFTGSMSGSSNALTASDVTTILTQGAIQADITRAAIRQPLGSAARVSLSVVDTEGRVLGIFRTTDAPIFGFDVSVQKARTAALFSRVNGGVLLRGAGFGSYVDRAAADGVNLNGTVAFSARAVGFLHRPFYPDGINNEPPGPFSTGIGQWSIFNVGLQLDLARDNIVQTLAAPPQFPANVPCTSIPNIPNGIQIFAGAVPLYKNGELVGAIGISGDGIDQDDIIASAGSKGYVAPAEIRADQLIIRGTRVPYVKFPRSPNL